MSWQVIVLLRIFVCGIVGMILLKHVSGLPSRIRNLSWMFFFCAITSVVISIIFIVFKLDGISLNGQLVNMIKIAGIGMVFNSFACYCCWRAYDLSMSKTALFAQGNNLTALALGFLFLGETKFLNPGIILGIILCLGAGFILAQSKRAHENRVVIAYVVGFSLLWGIDDFFTRYFALEEVPTLNFLTARYCGTYIGTLLLLLFVNTLNKFGIAKKFGFDGKKDLVKSPMKKRVNKVFALAIIGAWLPMVFEYWIRQQAGLVATEPIFLISGMVVPTLLGLVYFKEVKSLTTVEKIAFPIGIAGGLLIGFTY